MQESNDYIDLQFEEISSQRDVNGPSFTKGLIEFRFSVSPSGGTAWIPSMSYFLIDYTFTDSADQSPSVSTKMTLACDWPAHLFSATSFKIAGYEVCNVNNSCPQTHILKKRMGYVSEDFNGLAYNRDGYDADFSRRLGKSSRDGVFHKDGVRDCSNLNSAQSITPGFGTPRQSFANNALGATLVSTVAGFAVTSALANGLVTITSAAANGIINFIFSGIVAGDYVSVGTAAGVHVYSGYVSSVTDGQNIVVVPTFYTVGANFALGIRFLSATLPPSNSTIVADPRSGRKSGTVLYQPPVGIFDINDPTKLFGDFSIILTPNQSFMADVIESITAKASGDYKFTIDSMKFYIAKCKIPQMPNPDTRFTMDEFFIQSKQFNNNAVNSQNFDFILPPSTNKIVVFLQDSDTTSTHVSASRFKVRQNGDVDWKNKYGNYANTYDEFLNGIQVTYSGITKPQSMFTANGELKGDSNPMLQRWIHTMMMNKSTSPESFDDWLSMGPYFVFDFTRDELSNGSYCSVKVNYTIPATYGWVDAGKPGIVLCLVAIHDRDVAITYDQGRVTSVRSQIE